MQKTTVSTALTNRKYEMTRKLFDLKSSTKNLERNILAKINNLNNGFVEQVKLISVRRELIYRSALLFR